MEKATTGQWTFALLSKLTNIYKYQKIGRGSQNVAYLWIWFYQTYIISQNMYTRWTKWPCALFAFSLWPDLGQFGMIQYLTDIRLCNIQETPRILSYFPLGKICRMGFSFSPLTWHFHAVATQFQDDTSYWWNHKIPQCPESIYIYNHSTYFMKGYLNYRPPLRTIDCSIPIIRDVPETGNLCRPEQYKCSSLTGQCRPLSFTCSILKRDVVGKQEGS